MEKGQRVFCSLYGGRDGVVTAIHGTQSPETCQSICNGVGVSGGSAHMDIIWDDGTQSRHIPEALIRGSIQWKILDEVWTLEQIEQAKDRLRDYLARRADEKQQKEEILAREMEELKMAYPKLLTKENEEYNSKRAVKNIRLLLKQQWPKVKFSVRSTYSSVNVSWKDGPTAYDVDALINKFQAGNFNGMEDIYEYRSSAWTELFGGIQYVFSHRDYSAELTSMCVDTLWRVIPGNLVDIEKPTDMESFTTSYSPQVKGLSVSVIELVRSLCRHYDALKGKFIKPEFQYGRCTFVVDYAFKEQNQD